MKRGLIVALAFAGMVSAASMSAEVRLPHVFTDHAVLQRNIPLHVWGWASPGKSLTVHFHSQTVKTEVDETGEWSAWMAPEAAGGPYVLMVEGDGRATRSDLLVGDVWLASGQSNMEMPLKGFVGAPLKDSEKEIAAAQHSSLRLLHVGHVSADTPATDIDGAWTECTPETAANISAVGYFFGRSITQQEKVPVGIIDATWGGTPADSWVSMDMLSSNPALYPAFASRALFANGEARRQEIGVLDVERDAEAKAAGRPAPKHAWKPSQRAWVPAALFDGMIAPLTPLSIKGVIWYQGETNSRPDRYRGYASLFPALIADWRMHFAQGDFPFLYVQISSFNSPQEHWGVIRDAQRRALSLRNTAMIVSIDVGDSKNVHPADKQTIGARLALAAGGIVYHKPLSYRSPELRQVTREGKALRVWFDDAEGLISRGPLTAFEVAGDDHGFVPAQAVIEGSTVTVFATSVGEPRYVRYAWKNEEKGSVYNGAGLPLGTFTSEDTPKE